MSQRYREKQKLERWKRKAMERGDLLRNERKERKRIKDQRDQLKKELKEARARLCEVETQLGKPAVLPKVDVVSLALQLFLDAHISFRAVSRVLTVLAVALGIKKAPCPQTIINWVSRLSLVRIQSASLFNGPPLASAPSSNGLIWMIDTSIGLGTGKILAILALRANHHEIDPGAPGLGSMHCIAVAVADSWTGEAIAAFLERVIAVTGDPAAYLKDAGTDLQKATRLLGEKGHSSLSIDDISHYVANLLKWRYLDHPMFETFMSTCGRISGKLKQTILACLIPPKTQTKARFMNVHRLVRWAERLLKLSPPGRAPKGSVLSKLRACLDKLPECKGFIKGFLSDALPLLKCQEILKSRGLSENTLAQCEPLIQSISSVGVRENFLDYLHCHLDIAAKLGLEKIGMPITSDPIECLFGVGKQHGTGETWDADRIALRLPALCGNPTREEAELVLRLSVAEQHDLIGDLPSLTKQRRRVLQHPDQLDSLAADQIGAHLELIPGAKKRSNCQENVDIPIGYEKKTGPATACPNGCG
jgi:hypothetical protein